MIKEFKINDILDAVNTIYKLNKKKNKNIVIEKNLTNKDVNLSFNNGIKPNDSEVLVLDQMID